MNSIGPLSDSFSIIPPIYDCRILIADDNRVNREVLLAYLNHAGWHDIACVEDGAAAIDYIANHHVDLLLLDLSMPVMDGFEVCQTLRDSRDYTRLPIIVQTGFTGQDERRRAFVAGASDFVIKPIFREELIARVRLQLQNRLLLQRLERYHDRLSSELETARQMQARLVPDTTQISNALSGLPLQMATHYRPVTELGGDIWGVRRLADDTLGFYAADFSGHGVAPAIHTFKLATFLNRLPERIARTPAATLAAVAEEFTPAFAHGQHLAIFYGLFNATQDRITYSAVAMPPPLLLNDSKGPASTTLLNASGVPIGLSPTPTFTELTLDFAPGAQLLLYSDGLLDNGKADAKNMLPALTPERLATRLRSAHAADANMLLNETLVVADNDNHTADDVTVMAIGRKVNW